MIHQVGAYNMTQWMQFITLRPVVVMITENRDVEVIRKGEKMNSISDYEQIPTHLSKINL